MRYGWLCVAVAALLAGQGRGRVATPLDAAGNGVKAQKAIANIEERLGINLFSPRPVGLN